MAYKKVLHGEAPLPIQNPCALISEDLLQGLHGHLLCADYGRKTKYFCLYFVTERCFDKVGTDTCKWRVQNGHPCSVGYMKLDCIKTCVCGT